mgnify:CR=1 FL=1
MKAKLYGPFSAVSSFILQHFPCHLDCTIKGFLLVIIFNHFLPLSFDMLAFRFVAPTHRLSLLELIEGEPVVVFRSTNEMKSILNRLTVGFRIAGAVERRMLLFLLSVEVILINAASTPGR